MKQKESLNFVREKRPNTNKTKKNNTKSCIFQNFALSLGREFITIHDIEASLNSLFAFTKTSNLN